MARNVRGPGGAVRSAILVLSVPPLSHVVRAAARRLPGERVGPANGPREVNGARTGGRTDD